MKAVDLGGVGNGSANLARAVGIIDRHVQATFIHAPGLDAKFPHIIFMKGVLGGDLRRLFFVACANDDHAAPDGDVRFVDQRTCRKQNTFFLQPIHVSQMVGKNWSRSEILSLASELMT
jgi:hypothetical protein